MARHLGLDTRSFTRKYCRKSDGYFHLREVDGPCQFLDGKACSVYDARPTQCRTWPFWPENMNAKTWNTEIKAFCPGVGKGKLHTKREIEARLKEDAVE